MGDARGGKDGRNMAKGKDQIALEMKAAYAAMLAVRAGMGAGGAKKPLAPGQAVSQVPGVKGKVAIVAGKWVQPATAAPKSLAVELAAVLEAMRAIEAMDRAVEAAIDEMIGTAEHIGVCKQRVADAVLELRLFWPGAAQMSDGQVLAKVRALRAAVLAIDGYAAKVAALEITDPPDKAVQLATAKADRDATIGKVGWPDE